MSFYKVERKPSKVSPGWIVIKSTGEGFGFWVDRFGVYSNANETKFKTLDQLANATLNESLTHSDKCRFHNCGIYCDCYAFPDATL